MKILINLFINIKLDLIQKGVKVLLRNQVKSRMEACYSELVLGPNFFFRKKENLRINLKFFLRKKNKNTLHLLMP